MFQKKISRHKILEKELEWGRLEQGEKEETINISFSRLECVGMLRESYCNVIVLKLVQLMIVINQQES